MKKEIQVLTGFVAAASLAFISGGVLRPSLLSFLGEFGSKIGERLAKPYLSGISPEKIKRLFVDTHPDDLNHSIKKLFVASVNEALYNISILFSETKASDEEKKEAKLLIKKLQKELPDILLDSKQIKLDEPEIKQFLYERSNDDMICNFVEKQFESFGITEPFKSFLAKNMPPQLQLCFGEGLKNPDNQNAWIAFQRMLVEEIRSDIKQIADTQQSIKDDLSDLKFTQSGFSKEQIDELHELIKLLNNKKLIEVKIKSGIDSSLQSIENKANEIIKTTTNTQLTVNELKLIIEKINRQNRTSHVIMFVLAACLLMSGIFVAYKLINQPFTATIKVYGWESEQHNPLNGKGAMVLTWGDKTEKTEINRQGEAVFKSILPQFNGKSVAAYITDTEGEPYYLLDSMIKIQKNITTHVQILLHGLEKLEGNVFDDMSGEGLPDVLVTVAGLTATTDEKGFFHIEIPIEKQKTEQEIEISKDGYKSKRQTIPMADDHKYRTILERK